MNISGEYTVTSVDRSEKNTRVTLVSSDKLRMMQLDFPKKISAGVKVSIPFFGGSPPEEDKDVGVEKD